MNLLKFVELQRKNTVLHRIPIPAKIALPIIPPIMMLLIRVDACLSDIVYVFLLTVFVLAISLGLKAPRYALDIFSAFLLLYIFGSFVYVIRGISFIDFFVERKSWFITLLYIAYSVAFILSTTSIEQLEIFLRKIGFPKRWIITIIVAYNLIPAMYNEAKQILMHQEARGLQLSRNPLVRIKQLLAFYIPMIFVSLMRADYLEYSLRARGY